MREKTNHRCIVLDKNRAVEQMTWAPGKPMVIADKLIPMVDGSIAPDARPFNYIDHRQSSPKSGDATPWIDHIKFVFGDDDARHIILFRPGTAP